MKRGKPVEEQCPHGRTWGRSTRLHCTCTRCAVCGYRKHSAAHMAPLEDNTGTMVWDHEFKPAQRLQSNVKPKGKKMIYVQNELKRIESLFQTLPNFSEKAHDLIIAQQALMWALDPTSYRSPVNMITEQAVQLPTGVPE